MDISLQDNIGFSHTIVEETILSLDSYGTLIGAEIYFSNTLRNDTWDNADMTQKKISLVEATRAVDRLSYSGCKTDQNQLHQFPRKGNITVPKDIEMATYEIAAKLLDGSDIDMEKENQNVLSRDYQGVKTTYGRSFLQEHLAAGIVSYRAWIYLKPYLNDFLSLKLCRVS